MGTKGKIGISFIVEVKISMEGTITHLWSFGSEISEEARFGTRFAVEARPGQTVTAIAGHLPFCNGCSMDYLYKRCGYWV